MKHMMQLMRVLAVYGDSVFFIALAFFCVAFQEFFPLNIVIALLMLEKWMVHNAQWRF